MEIKISLKTAFILGAGFMIGRSFVNGICTIILTEIENKKQKEDEENGLQ